MFSMKRMAPAMALLVALAAIVALGSNAKAQPFGGNFGNVIFLHPDGSAMQQWTIARDYWYGPDANMYWDMLPEMAVYRGHMTDQLTGTSNGGATVHAFGYKVQGPESFGRDRGRPIRALSGFAGSISREAANRGNPVGLVNDGGIANEPGTGAFFAETDNRGLAQEQTLQLIGGRPGFDGGTPDFINDGEPDPVIIMGGGERWFLPEGTEQCTTAPTLEEPQLDCYVHFVPVDAADDLADGLEDGDTSMDEIAEAIAANGPGRTDGRNLLEEAAEDQYVIIRTRAEFDALMAELESRPTYAPKVLGLFAASDIFNDEEEEELAGLDFIRTNADPIPPEVVENPELESKIGSLVLWGTPNRPFGPMDVNGEQLENEFGVNPPSAAEMTRMAVMILDRRARLVERRPFHLVTEVESTDNFPNKNNAIGTLRALLRADQVIKVGQDFEQNRNGFEVQNRPGVKFNTLVLTAADSDGSAMQLLALRRGTTDTPFNPLQCNEVGNAGRSECIDQADVVTRTTVNPTSSTFEGVFRDDSTEFVDGIDGRESAAFVAEPDAVADLRADQGGFPDEDESGAGSFGGLPVDDLRLPFAVTWASVQDVAGGVLSRAQGLHAEMLRDEFSTGFDNTDVYRMQYRALFGVMLPSSIGEIAPDR